MILYTTTFTNKVKFLIKKILEIVKIKTIACFCNSEFDYKNAISTFSEIDLEEYKKTSETRLKEQVQSVCLDCEIALPKEKESDMENEDGGQIENVPTTKTKGFSVKVIDDAGKVVSKHMICTKCFKAHKRKLDYEEDYVGKIQCTLCDVVHDIDPSLWRNKLAEKSCCDCIIF